MGLKLGTRVSEYIVGGWCIGTVTDAAASRVNAQRHAHGPRRRPTRRHQPAREHRVVERRQDAPLYCNYKGNEKD